MTASAMQLLADFILDFRENGYRATLEVYQKRSTWANCTSPERFVQFPQEHLGHGFVTEISTVTERPLKSDMAFPCSLHRLRTSHNSVELANSASLNSRSNACCENHVATRMLSKWIRASNDANPLYLFHAVFGMHAAGRAK